MRQSVPAQSPSSSIELKPASAAQWVVVRTLPRQEKVVAGSLKAQGIRHFLPLAKRTKVYAHRRRTSHVPLFPGYLFVRGDALDIQATVLTGRTCGVLPVSDQTQLRRDLARLRRMVRCGEEIDLYPRLTHGCVVRITSGPLKGLEGLVEDIRRPDRLVLHIHDLPFAAGVEIEAGLIETVE